MTTNFAGASPVDQPVRPGAGAHHCAPEDVDALLLHLEALEDPEQSTVPAYADTDWRVLSGTAARVIRFLRGAVLADVAAERARQDEKWGGAIHDDEHTAAEWVQLIEDYAGWARVMAGMGSAEKAERRLIQVAALAVAAVEASRRQRGA